MSERLKFGPFTLEPSLQRLTRDGYIVALKPKAHDLLCMLLANRDRIVGKDELMEWLWPRQEIGESNLSQTLYELRRALEDSAKQGLWIETVPRRGFRFVGQVQASAGLRSDQSARTIAILPFLQLDDRDEVGPLSLGVTDALITALAGVEGLVVRPLSAVMRYADRNQDAIQIGRQLQVDVVLEGSLQTGDSGHRVSARLLRVADGGCLWAGQFTAGARELFEIEDELAGSVADAVTVELTGSKAVTRRSRRTDDPEVHIACMKGQYCWHKWTVEAWMQAIRHFQRALDLQPDHAPSLAGLAAAWSTLGIFGVFPPTEAFARARESASQAVAIDSGYSRGHEIMGAIHLFHDWDLGAAADCLDSAIELDPDSCNARHLRALTLAMGGNDLPARTEIQRALRCDPQSLITRSDVGYIHYWGRRYRQAESVWQAVLDSDAHFAHARQALAAVLAELGSMDRALVEMRRALADVGRDPRYSGDLAWLLGRMGKVDEAREILSRLAKQGRRDYVDPYQIVLAHLGLEDHDSMFAALNRALANRSRDIMLIPVNPMFDPVRSDPRLETFLEKTGLDWALQKKSQVAP